MLASGDNDFDGTLNPGFLPVVGGGGGRARPLVVFPGLRLEGVLSFASGDSDSDGTLNPGFLLLVGSGAGEGRRKPLVLFPGLTLEDDLETGGGGGWSYMVGNRKGLPFTT